MQLLTPPAIPGVTAKPWGIPAILAGLALPLVLWGASLGIAIAEDAPTDLSSSEVITSLILTILILEEMPMSQSEYSHASNPLDGTGRAIVPLAGEDSPEGRRVPGSLGISPSPENSPWIN